MYDSYGRKVNYLRLSVTDRCNLCCRYCMPERGAVRKEHSEMLRIEDFVNIATACAELGVEKVRLTGGEPLVRKGLPQLIERIAALANIKELSLTTNGILLGAQAAMLKAAGLHRVNISLDTLDADKFRYITRGGELSQALAGIEAARRAGLTPVKINVVLIKDFNESEVAELIALAASDVEVRFIELMPFGEMEAWTKDRLVRIDELGKRLDNLVPAESSAIIDGPARYYRKLDGEGLVGFIRPFSENFCARCNRIRVTADGKLKPCLHSAEEVDLLPALNDGQAALKKLLEREIFNKPLRHQLEEQGISQSLRTMKCIGG